MRQLTGKISFVTVALLFTTFFKSFAQDDLTIVFHDELYHLMRPPLRGAVFTYALQNDTVYYSGKPYRIYPPENLDNSSCSFGFLNFNHGAVTGIPGHILFLIENYKSETPLLHIDQNYNLNFNDDGTPISIINDLPHELTFTQAEDIKFTLQIIIDKVEIRDEKQEAQLQSFVNPNMPTSKMNTVLPARYWVIEQRKNYRLAVEQGLGTEIALQDWNNNGRFDDQGEDKILVSDSVGNRINDRNQIYRYTIGVDSTIQYNGITFHIVEIDPMGRFLKLRKSESQITTNKILLKPGIMMPSFNIDLFTEAVVSWNNIRPADKYVLIDFWGTWCKPCLAQTDYLKSLKEKFTGRLEILALAYQTDRKKAMDYVADKELDWIQGFATNDLIEQFSILNFPYYILIGPNNRIIGVNMRLDEIEKALSGE